MDAKDASGGDGWPTFSTGSHATGRVDVSVERQPRADTRPRAPTRTRLRASHRAEPDARDVHDAAHQLRKEREIDLLQGCLREPLALPARAGVADELPTPRGVADVIAQKLRIASALRAERSLESWSITETARPEVHEWAWGAFRLSFGYQRADLVVQGPSVYPDLDARRHRLAEETIYTGSGMSAIAALVTALLEVKGTAEILACEGGYAETRELLERFAGRVRRVPLVEGRRPRAARHTASRILWLDTAVPNGFERGLALAPRTCDLAVVDTTCFWRGSSRLRRLLRWARQRDLPLALVRSHAKLDCLGVEYGRLGSIVLAWRRAEAHRWMHDLVRETRDSVRLLGCAAVPANIPPFTGDPAYGPCSAARTATIIRNTRRLARRLEATALGGSVRRFQHGLYLTFAPRGELRIRDVKRAVDALCQALASEGLPVRHAGSFGFDFVAIEWFPDPVDRRHVVRVAPGDLPGAVIDRVADGLARWFESQAAQVASAAPTNEGACDGR